MLENNGIWRWGSLQDEGDATRGNRSSLSWTLLLPVLSLLFGSLFFLFLVSLVFPDTAHRFPIALLGKVRHDGGALEKDRNATKKEGSPNPPRLKQRAGEMSMAHLFLLHHPWPRMVKLKAVFPTLNVFNQHPPFLSFI